MKVKLKEQSWVAKLAAKKMKAGALAIVFGRTVHLWNISRQEFLQNPRLMVHEIEHVRQYQRHGFVPFLFLYLADWIRTGYYRNRFEVEARAAEERQSQLKDIEFV